MSFLARKLVSQNKQRYQSDGFDLDLTYLTDEIICMGLPSTGREAMYRNPIDEVVRFLNTNHANVYKVFNLCNERSYDISKFGDRCASFPFEDHGTPPLALISAFCASAKHWMLQGLNHVVAVHCKAGKGRTGLMSCCLVMHLGYQRTAADAIAFYNGRRVKDGKGLTVASQRRYVSYYERVLAGQVHDGPDVAPRVLTGLRLTGVPSQMTALRVTIHSNFSGGVVAEELLFGVQLAVEESACIAAKCSVALAGDVRVSITDAHVTSPVTLARAFINPHLEPAEATYVLYSQKEKSELDVISKGILSEGFALTLCFEDSPKAADRAAADAGPGQGSGEEAGAPAPAAPAAAPAAAPEEP